MTRDELSLSTEDLDSLLRELASRGGRFRFRARTRGISMQPLIHQGDTILVEVVRPSQLGLGDLVLYRWPKGPYIVHRLIKKEKSADKVVLVTQGDNHSGQDIPFNEEQAVGRVLEVQRDGYRMRLDRGAGRVFNSLVYRLSPWKPWRFSWLRWLARYPWRWVGRLMG